MSSKVTIQATSGGRRTPLSLGTAGQKSNSKTNNETNATDSTTLDFKHRKSDDKAAKLDNRDSPTKNSSAKETTNNSTDKKEKTSKKDSITSHENGHDKDEKIISQKDENLKKVDKKISRESQRNKDVLKPDVRENNKETEKTKATISTRSKSPEKEREKRNTPIEKVKVDEESKNEMKKKDQTDLKKTNVEENIISKRSSRASTLAQQSKQEANASGGSLALQSEFHGFQENDNDIEMESLLLDVDVSEAATTIPTAAKTLSGSPSLRSSSRKNMNETKEQSSTPTPKRNTRKDIKPISPPKVLPAIDVPVTSTPEGMTFYSLPQSSLREISGRRSLRPLKEYKLQYNTNCRESYRPINTELDWTNNTSTNVTVGSENIPQNESFLSSFFSFGKGKKRALTPPPTISTNDDIQDDAVNTNTASPKRARLDFSGLMGLVSSPVTMLKNRLARTQIDSSTPNNKSEDINDIEDNENGVENVSEILTEEQKLLIEERKLNKIKDENINAVVELDDNDDDDDDEEENDDIIEKESVEHLNKIEIGDKAFVDTNDDVVVYTTNRRGRCDIM